MTPVERESHLQRMAKLAEEISKIKLDLHFGDDNYGKSLAELEKWKEKSLEALKTLKNHQKEYDEESAAIAEAYALKREEIERNTQKRLSEIRQNVNSQFQTDLQNRINAIDREMDSWLNSGMEEAEAEALAQQLKTKAIQDLNAEVATSLDSIWNNELEKRLAGIEREKQAWIKKGVDEVKSTQWAEQAKADAQREAAMSVLQSQAKEFRAFKEGGYEGLRDYQLRQLRKSGIRPEDLEMTPQQLADFQTIQQAVQKSLLPNFMTDIDKDFNRRVSDYSLGQEQRKLHELYKNPYLSGQPVATINGVDMTNELRQLMGLAPLMSKEEIDKLPSTLAEALEGFNGLNTATENLQQKFDSITTDNPTEPATPVTPTTPTTPTIPDSPSDFGNSINLISSTIENLSSNFDDLTPTVQNISSYFDELSPQIAEVTSAFGELGVALSNIHSAIQNNQQQQQNTQPPNITNNISIQEAHAWDYDHIEYLAEKVADIIEPKILNAIGGNSNGY